jgi:general stress protein 26
MKDADLSKFLGLVDRFDTAMLVSLRDGELRSRPMAIGDTTDDGRIRFVTRDDSGKLRELEENSHVNVAMQGDATFLSVSGNARLTKDPKIIDKAWHRNQRVWFTAGRDDSHVMAIEVIPTFAEYWDRREVSVLTLAMEQARKAVAGEKAPEEGHGREHGDVDFRGRPV